MPMTSFQEAKKEREKEILSPFSTYAMVKGQVPPPIIVEFPINKGFLILGVRVDRARKQMCMRAVQDRLKYEGIRG